MFRPIFTAQVYAFFGRRLIIRRIQFLRLLRQALSFRLVQISRRSPLATRHSISFSF
jgi:hypothetical protein